MKNILFASVSLLVALPAHALVGGAVDDNLATSPWAGVGAITINNGTFTGALISDRYVLTAAHVVSGQVSTPGNVSFTLNAGSAASQVIVAESITVFPGYTGTASGLDGVWHDDLALIRLAAPVSADVPVYDLFAGDLSQQTVTLVGYGASGDGATGATVTANPTVKHTGQNRIDGLLVDDDGSAQDEVFLFDFDGLDASSNVYGQDAFPNLTLGASVEAQFAGGDSGSPVFVDVGGVWMIAGIANFNGSSTGLPGSNVTFGSIGGGSLVEPYLPWIQETITAPVPEADVYALMLTGLGLVAWMASRRRKAS